MPANKNAATGGNLTRGGVFFCYSPHPQRSRENRRLATTAGTSARASALVEFRQVRAEHHDGFRKRIQSRFRGCQAPLRFRFAAAKNVVLLRSVRLSHRVNTFARPAREIEL